MMIGTETILGDDYWSEKGSYVSDERIRFIVQSGKFPKLHTINLMGSSRITDAAIIDIAHGCPQLTSINLFDCNKVTDAGLLELAKGCSHLTSLNLGFCDKITDASGLAIARNCKGLVALSLHGCENISDKTCIELARRCRRLQFIDLCMYQTSTQKKITKKGRKALKKGCRQIILEESWW